MNWGYKTTPQPECSGREIDYSRGLGLGGSSAINFGVYTIGARDDYDEWARLVGDDTFAWAPMQKRFKSLESFHESQHANFASYAQPRPENHGASGPLHVGYANEWEDDLPPLLDTFKAAGWPVNPDHNSGDPVGMSVLITTSHKGLRSTAKDLLSTTGANLTIVTEAPVQRLVLEGKKAVGVESNGKKYLAAKEVVLCAGSLNNPSILMHSGIGPADQLKAHNIPVVLDQPALGQGLRDHVFSPMVFKRKPGSSARPAFYGSEVAMAEAMEQWRRDGTGPWSRFACEMGIGFFTSDKVVQSPEFASLPADEKKYLTSPTVPHYELLTHMPIHWFIPGYPLTDAEAMDYSCFLTFLYNAQTRGEVTLQSADPAVPLRFNPRFLEHAFDRRVAIESLREVLHFARGCEAYTKDTVGEILAPKSDSDEDLLQHYRDTLSSSWHMTGTAKMGRPGDEGTVVDPDFKLLGIEGVRLADMSVVPVLASCHVQSVAYVAGLTCAEKLVAEYGLA